MAEKLSASFVRTVATPGKYSDGRNLYLQVAELPLKKVDDDGNPILSLTKSWLFRYSRFGKDTWMGLGPYPDVSLKTAREIAGDERARIRAGSDPLTEKRKRKQAAADSMSFADCADAYIEAHKSSWKNPKHADQWRNTLTNIAGPIFGHINVADVDTDLVMRCLETIWTAKPETASRLRGRIENVLDWARVRGLRKGENPARWRGHLDKLLAARSKKVVHHAALPYDEIGAFMAELRTVEGIAPRALEFLVLTAARTGEVMAAEWAEVDIKAKAWTVPASRMKADRIHKVPLSPSALKALKAVEGHSDRYVFPGHKRDSHLSNGGMMAVLKRMGRTGITVHGFRSTFRDWVAEQTSYPSDVAEMALAHTLRDKTEAAYRRGDLFEKRRKLMNEWARYCGAKKRRG